MTTREQAIRWWVYLDIPSKIELIDDNTESLIKGIKRSSENLTDREIERIWQKTMNRDENIYLNRLKEQYKQTSSFKYRKIAFKNHTMCYNAVKTFCIDTQLLSFNDIEVMENEINSSF